MAADRMGWTPDELSDRGALSIFFSRPSLASETNPRTQPDQ